MEPLTPPSMDEIQEIVDRRQRTRRQAFRVTQVGVAGVMVGALFVGTRLRTDGANQQTDPAGDDAAGSDTTGPALGSETVPRGSADPDPGLDGSNSDNNSNNDAGSDTEEGGSVGLPEDYIEPGAEITGEEANRLFNLGAFWGAGYDYEQVVTLAQAWNLPELDAKAEAGSLISFGAGADVSAVVGEPDGPFPGEFEADSLDPTDPYDVDYLAGAFTGGGYSLDQARVLAAEWNLPLYETKAVGGRLVLLGRSDEVTTIAGDPTEG